jgi:hypothetical protein
VNKRNDVDDRTSNDELARRLYQRDKRVPPMQPVSKGPVAEPLASRREPIGAPKAWKLGRALDFGLNPVSERERRALFAALSKGTRANLGREPTVAELVRLVEEVDRARALVSSAEDAVQGRLSVHIDGSKFSFRGSMQHVVQKRNGGVEGVA